MLFKRIAFKISGEVMGSDNRNWDKDNINKYIDLIIELKNLGCEVLVILGGGNIMRGEFDKILSSRELADHVGMSAIVLNGIFLNDLLKQRNIKSKVVTKKRIEKLCEDEFESNKVTQYLENDNVVISVGGTGLPFCSSDTAVAEDAISVNADLIIKTTKTDGLYNMDPNTKNKKDLIFYRYKLSDEAILENLKIMDKKAFEVGIPVYIHNNNLKNSLTKVINGTFSSNDKIGSFVGNKDFINKMKNIEEKNRD